MSPTGKALFSSFLLVHLSNLLDNLLFSSPGVESGVRCAIYLILAMAYTLCTSAIMHAKNDAANHY